MVKRYSLDRFSIQPFLDNEGRWIKYEDVKDDLMLLEALMDARVHKSMYWDEAHKILRDNENGDNV